MNNNYKKIADAIQAACTSSLNGFISGSRFDVSLAYKMLLTTDTAMNAIKLAQSAMLQMKKNGQSLDDLPLRSFLIQLAMYNNSVNTGRSKESLMLVEAAGCVDEPLTMDELECFYRAKSAIDKVKSSFGEDNRFINDISETLNKVQHGNLREEFAFWKLENDIYGYNAAYSDSYDVREAEGKQVIHNSEILKQIESSMTSPKSDALDSLRGTFSNLNGEISYSAISDGNASFILKEASGLLAMNSFFSAVNREINEVSERVIGHTKVRSPKIVNGAILDCIEDKSKVTEAGRAFETYIDYLNVAVCGSCGNLESTKSNLNSDYMTQAKSEFLQFMKDPTEMDSIFKDTDRKIVNCVKLMDLAKGNQQDFSI
ncbi:hypothetical protein LMH73_011860 [Vibrio splendidus]|nr:hypothetical protein [Vibrio splendidus]MCC4881555.1 hypothetical protein [Vibrio splendidus]